VTGLHATGGLVDLPHAVEFEPLDAGLVQAARS
jgi:hypothetical protein